MRGPRRKNDTDAEVISTAARPLVTALTPTMKVASSTTPSDPSSAAKATGQGCQKPEH
jgi:hypothetical protein